MKRVSTRRRASLLRQSAVAALATFAMTGMASVAFAEDAPAAAGDAAATPTIDAKTLPQDLQDALKWLSGFQVAGLVDTSYNYNFNDPKGRVNNIHVFDSDANAFHLDLAQLKISRTVVENLTGTVNLDFGETAKILDAGTSGLGSPSYFGLEEAYIAYKFVPDWHGGITLTAGKFVTLYGAEVIEAPKNMNVSRGILFGWAIPFTHTGAYVSVPIVESKVNVDLGFANGWDNVDDNNGGKTFLGQVDLTLWDGNTINIGGTYGAEQAGQGDKRGLLDVIFTQTLGDSATLVLNFDYGSEEDVDFTQPDSSVLEKNADWTGFAGFFNYNFTDKLSGTFRGEVFRDDAGARTGTKQTLWEITLTGGYKIVDPLVVRAEYRHDGSGEKYFLDDKGDGTKSQDQVAMELYLTF